MKKMWDANFASGFTGGLLVFSLSLMLSLVSCQKKDDGGSSSSGNNTTQTTYAQTPTQNCNIPGNTNCTPSAYNEFNNSQFSFLPYQWNNQNGFCGCPAGYRPVVNNSWGFSCAPNGFFPGYINARFGYGYFGVNFSASFRYNSFNGGQNFQWSSIPQYQYTPAVYGNSNCYANAAAVCDIRTNNCSGGGQCRAISGGSYMGLCTYVTGNYWYGGGYR